MILAGRKLPAFFVLPDTIMKKTVLLCFVLFATLFAKDNTKLLTKVIDLTYNLKFEEAEIVLNSWFPVDNLEQSEKYYNLTRIQFLKYLGTSDSLSFVKFQSYADSALIYVEGAKRGKGENYLSYYIQGTIYTMRAFMQSRLNNTIKAFLLSRDAVSAYEEAIELNPEFYDSYQGLGLFNYALSYVPGIYNIALSLTGLSSDKKKGLDYLRVAWEKGVYDRPDAGFNLAKIYMDYVAEYDSAETIYKDLLKRYPGNVLYLYQYAILKYRTKDYKVTIDLLNKVIKRDHPYFRQTTAYAYFLKGDTYLSKGEYEKALENYEKFLSVTLNIDYLGSANYRAAVCAKLIGDEVKTQKYLMLSGNGNPELAEDKFANEKGNYLLKNGFSETEIKIHIIEAMLNTGKYGLAADSLKKMISDGVTESNAALVYYYYSLAVFELRDYGMAERYAIKSLKADKGLDKWLGTGASLILTKIYLKAGRDDLANDFLDDAEDENSYQKSEIFESQINSLKRKMGIL